jgi:hypothetical protein
MIVDIDSVAPPLKVLDKDVSTVFQKVAICFAGSINNVRNKNRSSQS